MAVVGPNVRTLGELLRRNKADFPAAISKRQTPEHRRRVRRRLLSRRARAIRLAEESPVRRQYLQLVWDKLKEISRRMDTLLQELEQARETGADHGRGGIVAFNTGHA